MTRRLIPPIPIWAFCCLLLAAAPGWSGEIYGMAVQGGLIFGRATTHDPVMLDGKPIAVAENGLFTIGFARDAKAQSRLVMDGREITVTIAPRHWDVQHIKGLPEAMVTPDPTLLQRIYAEKQMLAERRAVISNAYRFDSAWILPAEGRISGVFGSQRILNGKPRAPHSGTDIAAPTGSPVRATNSGRVSLVQSDLYYTGQTVMIDHGLGLQSVYAHLSRIDVQEGQIVQTGDVIGAIGATGRATGPHLHWGISWQGTGLDPLSVLESAKSALPSVLDR